MSEVWGPLGSGAAAAAAAVVDGTAMISGFTMKRLAP